MKLVTVKRITEIEFGTFGVMFDESEPFSLTLERKWLSNQKGISCIPTGEYICKRVTSPKFGNTFEVTNVSGRSEILFHKGNIDDDSHGCILIAEQFEPVKGKVGIASSGQGFGEFLTRLKDHAEFKLLIQKPTQWV